MRSAQNAGGHAGELTRRSPCANPDRAGFFAGDVAENTPKRAEAFPAGLEGDIGDRQVAIAQQGHGALDAASQQVPMRWDSKSFLEGSCEVRVGNVAYICQPLD